MIATGVGTARGWSQGVAWFVDGLEEDRE